MILYNGESVTVDAGVPTLETMGVQLARLIRFGGATRDIYTVLPHTLVVAALMPEELAIHGLLHDVPEICCGDVPTPWKTTAAEARERILLDRVYDHYGFPTLTVEADKQVKIADRRALTAEAHILGHHSPNEVGANPDEEALMLTALMAERVYELMIAEKASEAFVGAINECLE